MVGLLAVVGLEVTTGGIRTGTGTESRGRDLENKMSSSGDSVQQRRKLLLPDLQHHRGFLLLDFLP